MAPAPLRADEAETLAPLLAASPLLRRYQADPATMVRAVREGIGRGDVVLVYRTAEGVLGLAWLQHTQALDRAAYLRLLLVAEGQQGRGIGAALLRAVEAAATAAGAKHLLLLATADNTGAHRFYEQHGYTLVGRLPGYVRPDLDEVLYHRPLRPTRGER